MGFWLWALVGAAGVFAFISFVGWFFLVPAAVIAVVVLPRRATVVLAFVASSAFAGEITGNGQLKAVHGNSSCAYSGQEDLRWYTDNSDTTLRSDPTRGDPAHAQNWGHVKQDTGLTGGANSVPAAEWGCNAHLYGLK